MEDAEEETWEDAEDGPWVVEEEEIYVAVGSKFGEGKATLLWALKNCSEGNKIVLVHVYQPAPMIPSMGIEVPASQLDDTQVREYQQLARETIDKVLDKYLALCLKEKRHAMKLLVKMDDIGGGLLEMIKQYGVKDLVMGAAEKYYSSNMNVPISKTAIKVRQHADPSCKIWFVCKGNLLCTRDASRSECEFEQSTATRLSTVSSKPMPLSSTTSPRNHVGSRSRSVDFGSQREGNVTAPDVGRVKILPAGMNNSTADPGEVTPASTNIGNWESLFGSYKPSDDSSCSESEEALSSSGSSMMSRYDDQPFSSSHNKLEDAGMDDRINEKLRHAIKEVEDLRNKLYEESCKRQDAAAATLKAKESENLYIKELNQRKEAEDELARKEVELEELKHRKSMLFEKLRMAHDHESKLKFQNIISDNKIKDMQEKLSAAYHLHSSLTSDYEKLQLDRDNIVKEYEKLTRKKEEEDAGMDDRISEKLRLAIKEVEDLRNKLNEESCKRQKAEEDAAKEVEDLRNKLNEESCKRQKAEEDAAAATLKAKESENLYIQELNQRKEAEDELARKEVELEELKHRKSILFEKLRMAHDHESKLKFQNIISDNKIKDMQEKLSATNHLHSSLTSDYEKLQLDRDNIVKEYEKLTRKKEEVTSGTAGAIKFLEFSYLEIKKATNNFDESMKIGSGGYGNVYKGSLRHTEVAIKKWYPESMQGQAEFEQEVEVLSKMRHPHIVTLIGTCPEARALIYGYCAHGSLEDRLSCKDKTAPLNWQVRIRIAVEVCSSLIFLHSSKPQTVVHGDLSPENILLDANFMSKLGDFGLCHLLSNATTPYRQTIPKGNHRYMDPELRATGELTPYCDVYSFGIVLLRLLTGRCHPGIVKQVQEALHRNCMHQIIDPTASWPIAQAVQLAQLALRCCEPTRKKRPNLAVEVWKAFEPIKKAASSVKSSYLTPGSVGDNTWMNPYFLCPISLEVMKDPHVAADGLSYEANNLKEWFRRGKKTSPKTNQKLRHLELIPNLTLRSAIREWQQYST